MLFLLFLATVASLAWAYRRERFVRRVMASVRETPQLPPLPDGWDVERDRPRCIVSSVRVDGKPRAFRQEGNFVIVEPIHNRRLRKLLRARLP